jgi:hypothetical protein
MLGAGSLVAKIKPHDYTTGNETFSADNLANSRFSTQRPTMDTRLSSQVIQFGQWHGTYSSLGQTRAPISANNQYATRAFQQFEILEQEQVPWSYAPQNARRSSIRSSERFRNANRDNRFDPMERNHLQRLLHDQGFGDKDLSMQDINRYQFRRTRSTEPGLPVQSPAMKQHDQANTSFWDMFSDETSMKTPGHRVLLPSDHAARRSDSAFSNVEPVSPVVPTRSERSQARSTPVNAEQRGAPMPSGQSRMLRPGEGGAPEVVFEKPRISVSVE